jgi:ABC-2 type transport system ATP-binding protein
MTAVVVTRQLTKRYGETTAVDRLDLEIRAGEVFGLLGPNGAGKTTTILMLLGLTEPTEGSVEVLGMDPSRRALDVKAAVGYLPDDVGFYDDMTGRQNLRYTARLNRLVTVEARRSGGSPTPSNRSASPTSPTGESAATREACASGSASPTRS